MYVFFFVNSNINGNWIIEFGNFSEEIPLGFLCENIGERQNNI